MMSKIGKKEYLKINLILLIYSFSAIISKFAAQEEFFSFDFFVLYGIVLLLLFIYALFWQQILKKVPLTVAYMNKAITVVWGMIFGKVLFSEKISFFMILGSIIIFVGIYMGVRDNE